VGDGVAGVRAITSEEIKRISKCLTGDRWEHRNRAMLYFLAYTACRVSECRNIQIKDIYSYEGNIKDLIRIRNTKNGDDRDLFISGKLKTHMKTYLQHRFTNLKPEEVSEHFLFEGERHRGKPFSQLGIAKVVNKFIKKAGVDSCSHGIRKGAISALRRAGMDVEQCRVIGGWKDLRTILIYWKADEREALDGVNALNFG
jgi:site-specific recombinase XerD